jgi:hypothetical protein
MPNSLAIVEREHILDDDGAVVAGYRSFSGIVSNLTMIADCFWHNSSDYCCYETSNTPHPTLPIAYHGVDKTSSMHHDISFSQASFSRYSLGNWSFHHPLF